MSFAVRKCSLLFATYLLANSSAFAVEPVDFNRDIRPLLSNNCLICHGPDEEERAADLRLDTQSGSREDLGGHSAVVPGDPDSSEMLVRILSDDEYDTMPPEGKGRRFTPAEVDLIRRWIQEGASYAKHWSYEKPVRSPIPEVSDGDWPRNAIDAFILSRLDQEGLKPSPEADRLTLARRLSIDLIGLPPTWEEAEAFAADTSDHAYESYVDRLMAKPAFGERWAHVWLDLARYADSSGYADDQPREIWAYRDYVIKSLNANKPFDEFTIEQIAGDLIDNPSEEQIVATAFHRNTMTNNEGGTNDEEFRNVAVVDRVNTTMAVWMGTTIACAQCHTHKYDPLTHEDYFKLFAFFNNTEDADRSDETPRIDVWTNEQKAKKLELASRIETLVKAMERDDPEIDDGRKNWIQSLGVRPQWNLLVPKIAKSKSRDLVIEDTWMVAKGDEPDQDVYTLEFTTSDSLDSTLPLTALRLEVSGQQQENFVISGIAGVWKPSEFVAGNTLKSVPGDTLKKRDTTLIHTDRQTDRDVIPPEGDSTQDTLTNVDSIPISFASAYADFEQKGFRAMAVLSEKVDPQSGWAVAPMHADDHELTLTLKSPLKQGDGTLTLFIRQESDYSQHLLNRFRIRATSSSNLSLWSTIPDEIQGVLVTPQNTWSKAQATKVAAFYRTIAPQLAGLREQIASLKNELESLKPSTTVPRMQERAEESRRVTHIQLRGNYLSPGAEVQEGTPAVFPPLPHGVKKDRLALARWLVSDDNPLTSRVIANRHWEEIFGIGIVETSEEFGSQGELPSHPELLDTLAVELRESGWDLKHLLKWMVTSATYRQSSVTTQSLSQSDPTNRLYARGPRFRVSAESVRDQALFVGGLLSEKMYGPSVNPMQPVLGLKVAFGEKTDWETSLGEDRHRRGLYTSWLRSSPYPSMAQFDAPNREVCSLRRIRTNTPLQALVTLNDPVYIEAAQSLARKVVASNDSIESRIEDAFHQVLIRDPSRDEQKRISDLVIQFGKHFETRPEDAKQMATIPLGDAAENADLIELATWTVVSNVILNLDEVFMKR
jgi:hypothetical protein